MSAFDAVDGSCTGTGVPWMWVPIRPHDSEEPSHASDYDHRSRHCEVGFPGSRRRCEGQCGASPPDQAALRSGVLPEAAAVPGWHRSLCSAHHWSRELQALSHTVRLMPPAYVTPYVKRHMNDAIDAEAICEAVTRPNMRFVATKTRE